MLTSNHIAFFRSNGILIARVLMGGMFMLAGLDKLQNSENMAEYIASAQLPESILLALAVGAFEIVLGLAIVVGKKLPEAALLLAVFVVLVSFLYHSPSFWADAPVQKVLFTKNLAIIAGLLYMVAYGAGEGWSLGKSKPDTQNVPIS